MKYVTIYLLWLKKRTFSHLFWCKVIGVFLVRYPSGQNLWFPAFPRKMILDEGKNIYSNNTKAFKGKRNEPGGPRILFYTLMVKRQLMHTFLWVWMATMIYGLWLGRNQPKWGTACVWNSNILFKVTILII